MTVIKINSDNVKVTRCKDCPFSSCYDITSYGETTGKVNVYCNILEKIVIDDISIYELEDEYDEQYKTFKHEYCPVISVERM